MSALLTASPNWTHTTRGSWVLKALLLAASAGLLSGCGSSIQARDYASVSGYTGSTSTTGSVTSNGAVAECNHFDSSDMRLPGRIATYYYNGVMQEDRARVRITGLDTIFQNTSGAEIKMYRWKVSSAGATSIDSAPLSFFVARGNSVVSGLMDSITYSNIQAIAPRAGFSTSIAAQDFFNQTTLIVSGVDYEWQAIKMVVYNGTSVIGSVDFLIPAFMANPNVYSDTHDDTLNALHPFWSQRTLSLSENDWLSRAQSYCF
jgi:hypothetical protein